MRLHPSFAAHPHSLSYDELINRLSNNCASVTSVSIPRIGKRGFGKRASDIIDIINALSRNTRVTAVCIEDPSFVDVGAESLRTFVKWLESRSHRCALVLKGISTVKVDRQRMEQLFPLLSSSGKKLNIKRMDIATTYSDMGPACIINLLSLLTADSHLEISSPVGNDLMFVLPHIHHVEELGSLHLPYYIQRHLCESILSLRNIRRLELLIADGPTLETFVNGLNIHHSQESRTAQKEICLELVHQNMGSEQLSATLARIPPRLSVDIRLEYLQGDETDVVAQALRSVPGLRSIELKAITELESSWVTELDELFHGRIQEFKLEVSDEGASLDAAQSLLCFRSSDLVTLNLALDDELEESVHIEVVRKIVDVVPTMSCLKGLFLCCESRRVPLSRAPPVRNRREHDEFIASSTSEYRPIYIAYDDLVEAIVCQSPSTTASVIACLADWQRDRLCFELKARLIRINTLLSTTTETPLSLLPLALSTLSVGHWYDVMAYIVRQKSDQLIGPAAAAYKL